MNSDLITRTILLLLLITPAAGQAQLPPPPSRPQHTITVDGGDVSGLIAAIDEANEDAYAEYVVTIEIAGDFHLTSAHEIPPVRQWLRITGPARFIGTGASETTMAGDEAGPHYLFQVDTGARLDLQAIEIADFSLNHAGAALIVNRGTLGLERVQVESTYSHGYCIRVCTPQMPLLFNDESGTALLSQVSFVNSGVTNINVTPWGGLFSNYGEAIVSDSQVYFPGHGSTWAHQTALINGGRLELDRSTLWFDGDSGNKPPGAIWTSTNGVAETVVHASILSGFSDDVCENSTSGGYNLVDNPDCGWSAEGDLAGVDAHLSWRPVDANWPEEPQILDHAAVPAPFSAAVDSVLFDPWSLVDLLGNPRDVVIGNEDAARSDRGAVELWKTGLSEGGINGLYYNPDADGHYVQIQQTDYLTLVIWNTFDRNGDHVWVYGTGQLVDGRAVLAETYINRGVMVLPGTAQPDSDAQYWGTLEVEMDSCLQGRVRFESIDPEFGRGEFPITRLAFIKQLGCVD